MKNNEHIFYTKYCDEVDENYFEEFDDYMIWCDVKASLELFIRNNCENGLIVCGKFGGWNGTFDGGKICDSFSDVMGAVEDCAYIKLYENKGHLYLRGTHHDGTNEVEIKALSERGREYADNHWEMDDRTVHKNIWNNNFLCHLPHLSRNYEY